jgi:hypothetical protein
MLLQYFFASLCCAVSSTAPAFFHQFDRRRDTWYLLWPLSRNRKFGYRLGQGESMADILASSTEVAEGVDTSMALVNLIKTRCKGYRLDLNKLL